MVYLVLGHLDWRTLWTVWVWIGNGNVCGQFQLQSCENTLVLLEKVGLGVKTNDKVRV